MRDPAPGAPDPPRPQQPAHPTTLADDPGAGVAPRLERAAASIARARWHGLVEHLDHDRPLLAPRHPRPASRVCGRGSSCCTLDDGLINCKSPTPRTRSTTLAKAGPSGATVTSSATTR